MKTSQIAILLTAGMALTYWSLTPGGVDPRGAAGWFALVLPVIFSALIVLIVFLWSVHLTKDRLGSVGYAVVAGFCTMIWPYAYIGIEAAQSFFLIIAAFISLVLMPRSSWTLAILLGVSSGLAVSMKPVSVFLLPAVIFLLHSSYGRRAEVRGRMICSATIAASFFIASLWIAPSADESSRWIPGSLVGDPFAWAIHAVALIGSPGKGLLFYTPVTLVSALVWRRAWKRAPSLVMFTVLSLGGLIAGLALGDLWADATWGPRHLHAVIAPLVLMIAASRSPGERLGIEYRAPLIVAAVLGFLISFAGMFFHYGQRLAAAESVGQATMQTVRMDPAWNHVKFNARLFLVWLTAKPGESVQWTPELHWYYDRPEWAPEKATPVALDRYAVPQPRIARSGGGDITGIGLLFSLVAGSALILYCSQPE